MVRNPLLLAEELLENADVVYMGSTDKEGYPNPEYKSHAAPRVQGGLRVIYLTTNTSSRHAAQYCENQRASLYVCDMLGIKAVILLSTTEVPEDSAVKKMIWRDGNTAHYPGGVTDPDYCVPKFTADSGRLYRNLSSGDFDIE